jgi:hypothetical protein
MQRTCCSLREGGYICCSRKYQEVELLALSLSKYASGPSRSVLSARFYAKLLELVDSKILLQKTFYYKIEEENKFKVKKILDY